MHTHRDAALVANLYQISLATFISGHSRVPVALILLPNQYGGKKIDKLACIVLVWLWAGTVLNGPRSEF